MNILTLTSLFPNHCEPNYSIFIKKRIEALSKLASVKVVAPVPWTLKFPLIEKYKKYAQIALQENQDGLEVFHPRYLVTPKIGRLLYGHMFLYSIKGVIRGIINEYPCDILDVHWIYPDGFAGVKLAKMLGIPVSVTVRGSDINLYPQYPFRRRLIAHTLKEANLVIAVCKDMVGKISALGVNETKIKVIPNGVDIKRFYPMKKKEARNRLGLLDNYKLILSVGRLESPKRFDLLIKAIKILIEYTSDILLIIIGEGTNRLRLEKLGRRLRILERVKLLGARPNEELVYWYNAADVFCLPSDSEGWPNVLFESLACGTPVVASNVGGIPEIIFSEDYGILVNKQDVKKWTQGIFKALTREWDKKRLVDYAQQNTWDEVGQRVYSEFQDLLNRQSKK